MKRVVCYLAIVPLLTACGPDSPQLEKESISESPIYYGQTTPTLYTSLTTGQRNAVVAICNEWEQGFCTGTVVSPHVVLTAAHCIETPDGTLTANDIRICVGDNYDAPIAVLTVSAVDYISSQNSGDDIGVIILSAPYAGITPIPYRRGSNDSILYQEAQAVGYGRTQTTTSYNPVKHWTTMPVEWMDDYEIMVNGGGETGVAPGDSGGPLLFDFGENLGVQVAGVASTSEEGWVHRGFYVGTKMHADDFIQPAIDIYDNPACLTACAGIPCGAVGECQCGGCIRGYQCVSNSCQEIPAGNGGLCLTMDPPGDTCSASSCTSPEICFDYPSSGNSECAEPCGPQPCNPSDPFSFCLPMEAGGGSWISLCIEDNQPSCTEENATCSTPDGRPGYCFQLFVDEPIGCYARCDTVVTCPLGTTCYPTGAPTCTTICQAVDCGSYNGCNCGDCGNGYTCNTNSCVCSPNCDDRVCGDNGCGGSCGICDPSLACNAYGRCYNPAIAGGGGSYYGSTPVQSSSCNSGGTSAAWLGVLAIFLWRRRR